MSLPDLSRNSSNMSLMINLSCSYLSLFVHLHLHMLMSSHAIYALWHDDFINFLFLLPDIQRVWKGHISLHDIISNL